MSLSLEKRVVALEQQMAQLRRADRATVTEGSGGAGREWLDDLYGRFAGDPLFAQAMKLGAKYRQSQRPAHRRNKK